MIAAGNVKYNYAQLMGIWQQAGGNPHAAAMAAAIAMAESGGNSAAYGVNHNGSTDRGLWQINSIHGAQSTFDIMGNARAAVAISSNGTNWRPWTTYNTGAYRQYLQGNVPAATNVPINGTNAAANQPAPTNDSGSLQTQEAGFSPLDCMKNPAKCAADLFNDATGAVLNPGKIIMSIIGMVINPLISLIAGVIGMTAGAAMMIVGLWMMISSTQTGQRMRQGAGTAIGVAGLAAGQPEVMAAGSGLGRSGVRGGVQSAGAQRTVSIRQKQMGQRQQQMTQRELIRQRGLTQRQQQRQQQQAQPSTRAQLNEQAYSYRQP